MFFFALFDDVEAIHHRVGEDTSLCSVIENHLKPGPWIHKLKPFCDVDLVSLKLFIRQCPKVFTLTPIFVAGCKGSFQGAGH